MDLLSFLITVIVIGAALYLLSIVPMDPTLKRVVNVIVIVVLVIWALRWLLGGAGLGAPFTLR